MKIHLARNCAVVAIALAASGINSSAAVGQYATNGSAPQYTAPAYGYPATSQAGYAPYASTGYGVTATQYQQSAAPYASYPTTPQQPIYTAMNTESGVVKSPAAPAPPAATNGSSSSNGSMSDEYECYGETDYGLGGYVESAPNRRQWFCGLYALAMERDEPNNARVGLLVDQNSTFPYTPVPSDTVLHSNNAGYEVRGGVELRFGSTITTVHNCCPPQTYAWEFGYWYLMEDPSSSVFINDDPTNFSLYSAIDFNGLDIPTLDPASYTNPLLAPVDTILAERVRTNFSAQSFELNILRLPVYCAGGGCGSGCGGCSGCCETTPCGPTFTMAGLCGFRYMRLDDDFQYALDWDATFDGFNTGTDTEMFYNVSVDNHLAGVQVGSNMNFALTGSCDLFCDSNFGLYNNHISANQRVRLGDGTAVTFINGGSNASVSSDKDSIAFAGELRFGGAYHVNCNNRLTLAYRVIAIGGVALTTDQIPTSFDSPAYVGLIDSSGSLLMHGIQAGWERKF